MESTSQENNEVSLTEEQESELNFKDNFGQRSFVVFLRNWLGLWFVMFVGLVFNKI